MRHTPHPNGLSNESFRLLAYRQLHRDKNHGFALIIALSMLLFLTLLMLSLSTLTTVEVKTAKGADIQKEAQQNALMALNIAFASLQELAGPDRRVTATASILDSDSNAIPAEHQHWAGVWSTESYNPLAARTNTSHFSGWLVSSPQTAGFDTKSASMPQNTTGKFITIRKGSTSDVPTVSVPLVPLTDDHSGSYAYWVEDLGVKADASVSGAAIPLPLERETLLTSLNASPASHAGIMTGNTSPSPWDTEEASVARRKTLSNAIHRRHVVATANDPLLAEKHWVDYVTGVYGLPIDVLNGGFKQDLSLAFEMDGDTTTPNNLSRFNASDFVGSGDRNQIPTTSLQKGPEQNFTARHLFLEPFTFNDEARVARGPTWHLLRNHYNLYKELTDGANSPRLAARGIGPNVTSWGSNQNYADFIFAKLETGQETNKDSRYITLPTSGAYAPLLLKTSFIFGLNLYEYDATTDTGKIAVVLDPVLFIWNPYNVSIEFDVLKVAYPADSSGDMFKIVLTSEDSSGSIQTTTTGNEAFLNRLVQMNDPTTSSLPYDRIVIHYLRSVSGTTVMQPGEVMVFSTAEEPMRMRQNLTPGLQFSAESGIRFTVFDIDGSKKPFTVNKVSDTTFSLSAELPGGKRFRTSVMLADSANLVDQSGSSLRNKRSASDQDVQFQTVNSSSASSSNPDGTALSIRVEEIDGLSELIPLFASNGKLPVLIIENGLKPTQPASGTNASIFADFNPFAHMGTETLQWRVNSPNRHLSFRNFSSYDSFDPTAGRNAHWGKSYGSTGSTQVLGAGIPQQPLLSIASLRHAPTAINTFEAPQAIGNSFAPVHVPRNAVFGQNAYQGRAWDSAWLMNNALFDSYFFSGLTPDYELRSSGYTVTASLSDVIDRWTNGGSIRNPRHRFISSQSAAATASSLKANDGYRKSAGHTLVRGSFNVNSTSAPAWAALLCGLLDIPVPQYGQSSNNTARGVPIGKAFPVSGSASDLWNGFRRLAANAIYNPEDNTGLAFAIVDEVKKRGPFMGLADFVNRRITEGETGAMGAVQAAIENRNLNAAARAEGNDTNYSEFNNPGRDNTAIGINGYIMQADLLEPLAPFLSARSDTFIIRAYGEVSSPENTDEVLARALCEVVVQRLPDYIDPSANNAYDPPSALTPINLKFGRRFQIVSFSWITP